MKKRLLSIIILSTITMLNLATPSLVFAETKASTPGTENELFHPFNYTSGADNQNSKIGLVNKLPSADWKDLLAGVVKVILGITGTIAFISFTFNGIMMVVAQGNEETIGKAKKNILLSVLALAIIAASYGIVLGISRLNFGP